MVRGSVTILNLKDKLKKLLLTYPKVKSSVMTVQPKS